MTIQQLIEILNEVKDKELKTVFFEEDGYIYDIEASQDIDGDILIKSIN